MIKLLLTGLIIVTITSCTLNNNPSGGNEKKNIENYSLAFLGMNGEGIATFDICKNSIKGDVVYLETSGGRTFSYPLTEIREEYLASAKSNKISIIRLQDDCEPIVIEKNESNRNFSNVQLDSRMFTVKGILKNSTLQKNMAYNDFYQYLFFCGFTNAANKMMKSGKMFFTEEEIYEQEISSPSGKGLFSAIYLPNGDFSLCQSYFDTDELVLRLCLFDGQETETLRDGATYRYPIELFTGVYANQARNNMSSAIFTPEGNLFPAKLQYTGSWAYYDNMIHQSFYYFEYGKLHDVREMRDFLLSIGLGDIVTDKNFKGYFCMTPKE